MSHLDEKLKEWATPTEARYVDLINEHGSARKVAAFLGTAHSGISAAIKRLQDRAALKGYSPEHSMTKTVPHGFAVKGVSTYYDRDGEVRGQWVKSRSDDQARMEALVAAAGAMSEEIPRVDPLEPPQATLSRLCNLYTLTDCHVGMRAWAKEGGADWDLQLAERTLVGCFEQMVMTAPASKFAVISQLGDWMHYDGRAAITPTHGHILDADGSFSQMVAASIRILRRIVDVALMRHESVHLLIAEGNHDLASSVWLRQMFTALYENEPRLTVNNSELPFYVHQHGKTMLAFHHGHQVKNEALPGLFAAQFARMWGDTEKRYCHVGHRHHVDEKEHSGMKVIQHPTLAARDAYAARGGWISDREASAITYHDRFGQVGRTTVSPEMLDAA